MNNSFNYWTFNNFNNVPMPVDLTQPSTSGQTLPTLTPEQLAVVRANALAAYSRFVEQQRAIATEIARRMLRDALWQTNFRMLTESTEAELQERAERTPQARTAAVASRSQVQPAIAWAGPASDHVLNSSNQDEAGTSNSAPTKADHIDQGLVGRKTLMKRKALILAEGQDKVSAVRQTYMQGPGQNVSRHKSAFSQVQRSDRPEGSGPSVVLDGDEGRPHIFMTMSRDSVRGAEGQQTVRAEAEK